MGPVGGPVHTQHLRAGIEQEPLLVLANLCEAIDPKPLEDNLLVLPHLAHDNPQQLIAVLRPPQIALYILEPEHLHFLRPIAHPLAPLTPFRPLPRFCGPPKRRQGQGSLLGHGGQGQIGVTHPETLLDHGLAAAKHLHQAVHLAGGLGDSGPVREPDGRVWRAEGIRTGALGQQPLPFLALALLAAVDGAHMRPVRQ